MSPEPGGPARAEALQDKAIVFVHVPKTAGGTLRKLLTAVYGETAVFWVLPGQSDTSLQALAAMPPDRRRQLKVITGHIPYGLIDHLLPQAVDYITLLRDPVARIRSLYQYIATKPGHEHHALASRCDITAFGSANLSDLYNHQTRLIAGDGHLRRGINETDLAVAEHNLRRFALAGVQERFDDFVQALSRRYGWRTIPQVENSNVAQDAPLAVPDEARQLIERNNAFDLRLHRSVLSRWS